MKILPILALALLTAGCGTAATVQSQVAPKLAHPLPSPTPRIRPSFHVAVFVPPRPHPACTFPHVASTHHARRTGPLLLLARDFGPPAQTQVPFRARSLPPRTEVELVWTTAAARSTLALATSYMTGPTGDLNDSYTTPAVPVGNYRITVEASGVSYASAAYTVTSPARLSATVLPDRRGEVVTIRGRCFVPGGRFALLAYHLVRRPRTVVLGYVVSDAQGSISLHRILRSLKVGEYRVQAFSVDSHSADEADTFLSVAI